MPLVVCADSISSFERAVTNLDPSIFDIGRLYLWDVFPFPSLSLSCIRKGGERRKANTCPLSFHDPLLGGGYKVQFILFHIPYSLFLFEFGFDFICKKLAAGVPTSIHLFNIYPAVLLSSSFFPRSEHAGCSCFFLRFCLYASLTE